MPFLFHTAMALLSLAGPPPTRPAGDRELIGFGLVVGLDGTGSRSTFTRQVGLDLKVRLGCVGSERFRQLVFRGMRDRPGPFRWPCDELPEGIFRDGNVSAVMVTARLASGASKGDRIDVTVSSMDDARSLQGGVLMMATLKGADGEVYAVAQGALSNTSPEGTNGTTSAVIKSGEVVERSVR